LYSEQFIQEAFTICENFDLPLPLTGIKTSSLYSEQFIQEAFTICENFDLPLPLTGIETSATAWFNSEAIFTLTYHFPSRGLKQITTHSKIKAVHNFDLPLPLTGVETSSIN
jgi:hypothetical protein